MADKKNTPSRIEEVTDIKEITLPLIHEYIIRQGAEDEDWLIEMLEGEITVEKKDKEGKKITLTRKRTFIEVRNAFARKYRPDLIPESTTKKTPVTKDILADLKRRKERR